MKNLSLIPLLIILVGCVATPAHRKISMPPPLPTVQKKSTATVKRTPAVAQFHPAAIGQTNTVNLAGPFVYVDPDTGGIAVYYLVSGTQMANCELYMQQSGDSEFLHPVNMAVYSCWTTEQDVVATANALFFEESFYRSLNVPCSPTTLAARQVRQQLNATPVLDDTLKQYRKLDKNGVLKKIGSEILPTQKITLPAKKGKKAVVVEVRRFVMIPTLK